MLPSTTKWDYVIHMAHKKTKFIKGKKKYHSTPLSVYVAVLNLFDMGK